MKKILILIILFTFLLSGSVSLARNQNKTIYVDDDGGVDFTRIQDAINAASNGDTIFVYSGIYYENILIDKSIILQGEDKSSTIIDGGGSGDVIYISSNEVTISGLTVKNSGINPDWNDPDAGIDVKSSNNNIYDIIADSNNNGIFIKSDENKINNNVIQNNKRYGIFIYKSNKNIIEENEITNNIKIFESFTGAGVFINEGYDCSIINNNFLDNSFGIISGYSSKINITGNRITSDSTLLLYKGSNLLIESNNIIGSILTIDDCKCDITHNNFLGFQNIDLVGGIIYFEFGYFSIRKTDSKWYNNYWGRVYPFWKFIEPFDSSISGSIIYLDADTNPANNLFDI